MKMASDGRRATSEKQQESGGTRWLVCSGRGFGFLVFWLVLSVLEMLLRAIFFSSLISYFPTEGALPRPPLNSRAELELEMLGACVFLLFF